MIETRPANERASERDAVGLLLLDLDWHGPWCLLTIRLLSIPPSPLFLFLIQDDHGSLPFFSSK